MEQQMCYKLNVNYPKLNGIHTDLTGPYFVKSIVKYLKTKAGIFSKELKTIQEFLYRVFQFYEFKFGN